MTSESAAAEANQMHVQAQLRGRVAILYALSQQYLFLPFAVLCMAVTLVDYNSQLWIVGAPFVLLIFAAIGASRLKRSYDNRSDNGNPEYWARQFTVHSGMTGIIWGVGAVVWFVPDSFPAQAYLVLAYLGMTATEFVARVAYRPAYLAHAATSLSPLAALLLMQGGLYAQMTVILMLCFVGVLYRYADTITVLLDESIILRHDNAQLIVRLSQEKRAAEKSRDMAQESERSKSTFISSISHEIRTPLTAILGMAQLLERGDLEKTQRDYVKVLLEAGRGLKILLDDIIALAQQDGKPSSVLSEEGCDSGQAARTVTRLMQPNAWEKRLRLSINITSGLPRAAADPRLVRRVLLKLVGNAIKFTERGNIEIAVEAGVDDAGSPTVQFRVTDTGPGIPGHLIETIFDPFAKADNSYARRYNGAGVGLAVAKQIVETMGGKIGVESEPGSGASFWLTLPALAQTETDESDITESGTPPSGLFILALVADSATSTSLEHLLAPFGNRVTVATELAEAVRMTVRGRFSLIIASGAGVDALAALPGQHTPILALAGAGERQPDGANTVLRWPASPAALYSAISAAMRDAGEEHVITESLSDETIDAAIDAKTFAELEKSLGLKTLIDILQSYLATAEDLATALTAAQDKQEWAEAGRLAQDFAGSAGGLGLAALTSAARLLAQSARDGSEPANLIHAADEVLAEHRRACEALRRLYTELAA